jgi:BASS family bile acid:Na+ symporter
MNAIDQMQLQFSPSAVLGLQVILAIIVFGVALELSFADFRHLLRKPRAMFIGLLSQMVALPLLTFALVQIADPTPSIALGLMMTAACPGGNMSNVLTHWAHGRTVLSMAMTTTSSLVSPLTTPLVFGVLGGLNPETRSALRQVQVPYSELALTIGLALLLPLICGMGLKGLRPAWAARLRHPLKQFGLVAFFAFVVLAVSANYALFWQALTTIFLLVLVHNLLALGTGVTISRLTRTTQRDSRAIVFETGIHNTALGLTLIFTYFQQLGGMALVVAWWGVWQLLTGGLLARYWAKRIPPPVQ